MLNERTAISFAVDVVGSIGHQTSGIGLQKFGSCVSWGFDIGRNIA
jgi:hypothetical protein